MNVDTAHLFPKVAATLVHTTDHHSSTLLRSDAVTMPRLQSRQQKCKGYANVCHPLLFCSSRELQTFSEACHSVLIETKCALPLRQATYTTRALHSNCTVQATAVRCLRQILLGPRRAGRRIHQAHVLQNHAATTSFTQLVGKLTEASFASDTLPSIAVDSLSSSSRSSETLMASVTLDTFMGSSVSFHPLAVAVASRSTLHAATFPYACLTKPL